MARTGLERSHLIYRDIQEQPEGAYYLIIEDSPMHRTVFAVDEVFVDKNTVIGYLLGKIVIQFSPHFYWRIVAKDYVTPTTLGELMEREAEEDDVMTKHKEAIAKKYEEPEEDEEGRKKLPTGVYA